MSKVTDEYLKKAQKILDPIIDVATGADGGVAFIELRDLLTGWIKLKEQGDKQAAEIVTSFERFSRCCEITLKSAPRLEL